MSNFFSTILSAALFIASSAALFAQSGSPGDEFGMASYYADDFAGKKTAFGLTYNPTELTCAHKRHPVNTMLKVTRLDNKKTVNVRVTDRGPYVTGRVIELSRAAAERLDMIQAGVAEVQVEVVGTTKPDKKTQAKEAETAKPPTSYDTSTPSARVDEKPKEVAKTPEAKKTEAAPEKKAEKPAVAAQDSKTARARLVGKEYQQYGLYKIAIEKPAGKGFAVQVASLENYENVFKQVADLQAKWFENILVSIEKGKERPVYKIMLGPFDTEAAATTYQKSLQSKHKIKGFVVNLTQMAY
jgi:rare lipoprotein A